MDRMRKLITEDPGLMADIMRPQPVFAQGKQKGYRVYPGRNRQAFTRLGLRPGDLVMAINGTPLDDPARGQEIFRTLGSSSEAHITVMRSGQQQDLTLNIAQVAQEAEGMAGAQGAPPSDQAQPPPPAEQPDTSQ
jgi:general secretion pathway protein C